MAKKKKTTKQERAKRDQILRAAADLCLPAARGCEREGFVTTGFTMKADGNMTSMILKERPFTLAESIALAMARGKLAGRAEEKLASLRQAGSGKDDGTHVETIKRRLIRCHRRERPGEGFAVYWGALCEPQEYLRSFLESNGYQLGRATPGEVVLIGPEGKETKISKDSHARLFRLVREKAEK
jgi:hypothetical protein